MTKKARIAHLAGPNATIQNTPALVTSNKARAKHNPATPDEPPQHASAVRCAAPSAPGCAGHRLCRAVQCHPLEADAAELYGPPDGYIDSAGRVHKERQSASDKSVYEVELRPEDGLYLLPYMATQADGTAWDEECAFPNAPEAKARQGFFPDGSRSFEEIDRLQIGEKGTGNLISDIAEVDFYRVLPSSGYTKGLRAERRTDAGAGDIPPSAVASISSRTSRRTSAPRRRGLRWRERPMRSNRSWRAASTTAPSGPKAARGLKRRTAGSP
jgi:L-asparaginase